MQVSGRNTASCVDRLRTALEVPEDILEANKGADVNIIEIKVGKLLRFTKAAGINSLSRRPLRARAQ